nr:hypothetical protein CFP56_11401 [Quercus suber]
MSSVSLYACGQCRLLIPAPRHLLANAVVTRQRRIAAGTIDLTCGCIHTENFESVGAIDPTYCTLEIRSRDNLQSLEASHRESTRVSATRMVIRATQPTNSRSCSLKHADSRALLESSQRLGDQLAAQLQDYLSNPDSKHISPVSVTAIKAYLDLPYEGVKEVVILCRNDVPPVHYHDPSAQSRDDKPDSCVDQGLYCFVALRSKPLNAILPVPVTTLGLCLLEVETADVAAKWGWIEGTAKLG